ncbi:uncharacterized protein CLAFUR5_07119 [Fulvia fulva]|uniref:Extracellular membrane protein CFEM domain-containing protein n=1 Tax=Passalora fulva TaxID=5499 RepID=A0A9Q8UQ14_PASFU|nr:uncharacterized protein CLAFUR5_07119 [Fulvia fulva]UJO18594.1 hypothetical protein CLAFUR5_07119 [Fulvia fulva]
MPTSLALSTEACPGPESLASGCYESAPCRRASLPDCHLKQLVTCAADVLPTYSCKPTNICFCTNDDLAASLKACLVKSCQTQDQLKAQKFRADTCGLPVRDKSSVVRGLVWSLFAIATFFTIARLLSRWPRLNGAGYHWDDWTLFALYPLAIVLLYADFLFWFYVCQPLYMVVIFLSKISLLLLYLRTWPGDRFAPFRITNWAMIGAISAAMIAFVIASIFQCTPIRVAWSIAAPLAVEMCTDRVAQVLAAAGLNIVFDVVVIALPFPKLIRLDISWPRKIGLLFTFSIGSLVTICSIIRITYMSKFGESENPTWDYTYIGIWFIVEVYCSIACACMPATAGLVERCISKFVRRDATEPDFETNLSSMSRSKSPFDPEMQRSIRLGATSPGSQSMSDYIERRDKVLRVRENRIISLSGELSTIKTMQALHRRETEVSSEVLKGGSGSTVYAGPNNGIKLEVSHWSVADPIVARLGYQDRFGNARRIELLGRATPGS